MSEFLSPSQFWETSPEIQARTLWLHKDAQNILWKIKDTFWVNSEKYMQALQAYDNLEKAFYATVESERKITKEEIQAISAGSYSELNKMDNEVRQNLLPQNQSQNNIFWNIKASKIQGPDLTPEDKSADKINKVLTSFLKISETATLQTVTTKIQQLTLVDVQELQVQLMKFISESSCPKVLWWINFNTLIHTIHLQIIEKQKTNLSKKLKDYLVLKWVPEEKQQEISEKILSIDLWKDALCSAHWMQKIVKILKDAWVQNIWYADKNNLLDFIESNLEITKEKYDGELFDIFSSKEKLWLLAELQNEKDQKIIESKLQENNFSPEEIINIQRLLSWEDQYKNAKENLEELKTSNKKEFETFLHDLESWKSWQESMKSLLHTKEKRELEEQWILPKSQELFVLWEENIPFYVKNTSFFLQTHLWEIAISREEFRVVHNNPEALKNLIDFKSTLNELGINKLWDFRRDIFSALENKSGNSFDHNNDFLWESEVVNFLGNTLVALWIEKEVSNNTSLDVIKQEFKIKNQVWAILDGWINQVNGNTPIEQAFINEFVPIKNNWKFESSDFREAIA